MSSVGWLFDKKGRVVFGAGESGHSLEQMMDSAIEAGAEDIEEYDDLVEVYIYYAHVNDSKHLIHPFLLRSLASFHN